MALVLLILSALMWLLATPPPLGAAAPGPEPGAAAGIAASFLESTDPLEITSPPSAVPGEILVRFRSAEARARLRQSLDLMARKVKFFQPSRRATLQDQGRSDAQAGQSIFDQLALLEMGVDGDVADALARLESNPDVLYAEPNYRLRIAEANPPKVPDDFEFGELWALQNTGQNGGKAGADIAATQAWSLTTGDRRIVVAILDTGVDFLHPDLAGNMWTNPAEIEGNAIDDDGNGYIDDVHGYDFVSDDGDPMDDNNHGTHVAGTIGALGDNRIGIAGVCWQVSLMALKAFDETGNGDVAAAIEAIRYAVANGARVVNASWGSPDRSRALEEAIAEASQAGVVFIAAAGNNSSDNPFYPAAYPHVVAVAATDAKDQRASFSNYGPVVTLAAPGENILSTYPDDSYGLLNGTSMAAPHVAGVAALVLTRHPEFTSDQVATILANTTDPITTDLYIGSGRLNAFRALLVDAPLPEVQLNLPNTIFGPIDIQGTARAHDLDSFSLSFGPGQNPTTWTEFHTSTLPVDHGLLLHSFSTSTLPDGVNTIRLTALNQKGQTATTRAIVTVKNVNLTAPLNNDILRAGELVEIRGTVYGSNLTYTVQHGQGWQPSTWSTNGITLANNGSQQVLDSILAWWDTRVVETNAFYTLKLIATSPDQTIRESVVRLLYLDGLLKPGWPQHVLLPGPHPSEDWRNVIVADLDRTGADELILVDHGDDTGKAAQLLVFKADGALWWSRRLTTGLPCADLPVVGDIDGDGFLEVFADVGDKLFAFRYDGAPLAGLWPVALEVASLGKVIADLDGDGKAELIAYAQNPLLSPITSQRQLTVFNQSGAVIQRWMLPTCDTSIDAQKILPAVANLDSNPDLEIVVPWDCYTLAAFSLRNTNGPLWTSYLDGQLLSSAAIGDLDNDGRKEIVIAAYDPREPKGTQGGIYVLDGQGKRLPGWPVLVEESFCAPPALADIDRDGMLEISIPSRAARRLHLLHHTGFEVDGWPIEPEGGTTAKSSTVIGDVNGDGELEVVMASPGSWMQAMSTGDFSRLGGVKAWTFAGQPARWPGSGTLLPLLMEATGGISSLKAGVVTLADLDHNGKLDVIAASIQDTAYYPTYPPLARKNRSTIYVWELDVPFAPELFPWPTYQNNPQRTGCFLPPPHVDQAPAVLQIPDQIVKVRTSFFPIQLDRYVDDPDDPAQHLTWTISGNIALNAVIDDERVATIAPANPDWTGKETLLFTARDPSGLESSRPATFEVRVDYNPPVAVQDLASTLENVPVEFDVLANDTNPQQGTLAILNFSRAGFGTVELTERGTLRYSPEPNRNGTDSFTYCVSDGLGGLAMGYVYVEVIPVNTQPRAAPDQAITLENTAVEIDALANDQDPDGDLLTLVAFTQPTHGTARTNAQAHFLYTPSATFHGLDTFTYTVSDGNGLDDTATVTVMVKPVNQPPVAADQVFTLNRNQSQVVNFSAADPDGDPLTYAVVQGPKHGQLFAYPATATYYPNKDFAGTDSFTYRANDGQVDSDDATVTFYVTDVNNPPRARALSRATKPNQPMDINLTATDDDGDPLSFYIVTQPLHGTLNGTGTNYTYTPALDFLGDDQFQFQASDGMASSAPATVSIKVTLVNTAPVADSLSLETPVNTPLAIILPAYDGESDPLSYRLASLPRYGRLEGSAPGVTYVPNLDYRGPDRFTFKANDRELDSNLATISIRVQDPNHPPVATNQTVIAAKDRPSPFGLHVTDPDGDSLRCVILKGPKHGRLAGSGTNYTYIPTPGFVGGDTFSYRAWDGRAYSNKGLVTIDISDMPPQQRPSIQAAVPLNETQLRLLVNAQPGTNLELQASEDLLTWITLLRQSATSTPVSFVDDHAGDFPYRFYRVMQW